MESIVSIFRRGFDNFFELLEDPASLTKSWIEVNEEIRKARYSLALKYDIPMTKANTELIKVLLSRIIPEKDTIDADVMMKTDDENEKQKKSKTVSLLLESCALNVAKRYKNIDLERIITMQIPKNNVSIIIEIITKIMEKYEMVENARVLNVVEDIFENASMQDCFKKILQNAIMQNFLKNIFQNASFQDVLKDILDITMDVLSISNQEKETSDVQQIAELELD